MKERLDVLLVKKGLASSREKAKAMIKAGNVEVKGLKEIKKAGTMVEEGLEIFLKEPPLKYVGRGGLKLERALEAFGISLEGRICMDIGASTGGFTDCMLQHGAARVYAIDVGHDQLAQKLRADERVVSMEGTNVRALRGEEINDLVTFASVDVSFISLTKVLEPAGELLPVGGELCCLVKPQFEAGAANVGKRGVVKDWKVHREVLSRLMSYALTLGFYVLHLDFSPIKGQEGNIEYLLHLRKMALEEPL